MKIKGIAVSFVTAMVMIGSMGMVNADGANKVFDGRMDVVVDKVERSDTYPAVLGGGKSPAQGYDYCIIHLTITRIDVGHVFPLLSDMAGSTLLVDTIEQTFGWKDATFTGINFRDVHDITSEKEFIEGTTAILLFQIPLQSIPSILKLAYFFGESWDDYYSPSSSRININLIGAFPIANGDVAPLGNIDGLVNVGDALVALRFALNLETPTQQDKWHGDVAPLDANNQPDPDGVINVGDALVILRKALGIIMF